MQNTYILFKKTTLDSIIVLGKELFEKQYKEFFANRRTVSLKNFIHELRTVCMLTFLTKTFNLRSMLATLCIYY